MIPLLMLIGFTGILMLFGYAVSTRLLRMQNPFAVMGMTWFLGEALYSMLINALGYVLPIRMVFWLVLLFLTVVTAICFWRGSKTVLLKPSRWVSVVVWGLAVFCAVVFLRVTPSDPLSLIHYPVPATILKGNFPIHDPFNPWTSYGYHYAPMLLAAAVSGVTGINLALSYALQSVLHAGSIVFFSAAMGYVLLRSWKGTVLVTLFAVGGLGFHWWYAAPLMQDMYSAYILGSPLQGDHQTPLRFVSYMFGSARVQPLIATVIHRAIGMGSAAMMAAIYAIYMFVESRVRADRIRWSVVLIVTTSVLALSLETTFVLYIAAVIAAAVLYRLTAYKGSTAAWMIGIAAACCIVAAVQGGVITTTLTMSGDTRPSAFAWNPDGVYHYSETEGVALWAPEFLRDFGFPLLLFPFVVALCWKRRREQWLPLFLAGLAAMHIAVPFIIDFTARPHNMDRLLHIGMGLSSIVLAWWLWIVCIDEQSSWRRMIAGIITFTTLLSTALNLSARIVFPDLEMGRRTFAPAMPEVSDAEVALHTWVRWNSALTDRFFYTQRSDYENPIHDPDFSVFVAYTGRFLVKRSFNDDAEVGKVATIRAVEDTCDPSALRTLKIDYVITRPGEQDEWFARHCSAALFEEEYHENGITVYRFNG